jgi:hypothetical protein
MFLLSIIALYQFDTPNKILIFLIRNFLPVFCEVLSAYGCSSLYDETSVGAAVDTFNVIVTQAIVLAVLSGHIKKRAF